MQLLLLVFNLDKRLFPDLQRIVSGDLASYPDLITPLWKPISEEAWHDRARFPSLHKWAVHFLEDALQEYAEINDLAEIVYLVRGERVPPDVLLSLAEGIEKHYNVPAVIVSVASDPETHRLSRVDSPDLPLRWRVMANDDVVLRFDIWSSRESRDAAVPDRARGTLLRVVYRQVEGAGPEYFAGSYENADGEPIAFVLPWSMVMALPDWQGDSASTEGEASKIAIAHPQFHLHYGFCWKVEVEDSGASSVFGSGEAHE